jgi:hypothetical protein
VLILIALRCSTRNWSNFDVISQCIRAATGFMIRLLLALTGNV